MAFLVKNTNDRRTAGGPVSSVLGSGSVLANDQNAGQEDNAVLSQWIHVQSPARVLPQTTTDIIFRVIGGRVLVFLLVGEVTTVLTAVDPVMKYSSQALTVANPPVATGTAVDLASTTNIASLEVGGTATVLGSGAAFIKNNAGGDITTLGRVSFILPAGQVYITTGGNNTTGAMKHDLWYMPLDEGAFVSSNGTIGVAKF